MLLMENEQTIIAKVVLANHRQQTALLEKLSLKADQYSKEADNLSIYEACEELLHKWQNLAHENEALLHKYLK